MKKRRKRRLLLLSPLALHAGLTPELEVSDGLTQAHTQQGPGSATNTAARC